MHWDCKIAKLEADLARRDEIIARLKEDADRLSATFVVDVYSSEFVCRSGCHRRAKEAGKINHADDCPITLHHALMKELE